MSLAFLYNFWVIIYRTAFDEITTSTILIWFLLDYLADFVYLMDILIHFRTGAAFQIKNHVKVDHSLGGHTSKRYMELNLFGQQ